MVKKEVVNHRGDTLVYCQFFLLSKGSFPIEDSGGSVMLKSTYSSCGIPANHTVTLFGTI